MTPDKTYSAELTVKEALEQGYSLWGYENEEFQHLRNLSEISPEYFENSEYRNIVLADKEPTYLSVNADDLHERISEELKDGSDFQDDTDMIDDAVKVAVNWEEIADKINESLKSRPYYYLTNIRLKP